MRKRLLHWDPSKIPNTTAVIHRLRFPIEAVNIRQIEVYGPKMPNRLFLVRWVRLTQSRILHTVQKQNKLYFYYTIILTNFQCILRRFFL